MTTTYKKTLEYLAPRPFKDVQMVKNLLDSEFGNPEETRTGNTKQLIYRLNGTNITFEIHDVGPTLSNGIEGKVKLRFYSEDEKSFNDITSLRIWDVLGLR